MISYDGALRLAKLSETLCLCLSDLLKLLCNRFGAAVVKCLPLAVEFSELVVVGRRGSVGCRPGGYHPSPGLLALVPLGRLRRAMRQSAL